jgi:hypothetical protein
LFCADRENRAQQRKKRTEPSSESKPPPVPAKDEPKKKASSPPADLDEDVIAALYKGTNAMIKESPRCNI